MPPKGAKGPGKGQPQKGSVNKGGQQKAAEPALPSLESLFSTLDGYVQNNETKKIIKLANEILARAPQDAEAFKCKLVALVQEGQYTEALELIEGPTKPNELDLSFEKAYCLYRTGKVEEAIAGLGSARGSAGGLQLEAQAQYRLGRFAECAQCYQRLMEQHKATDDIKTNLVAAYISGGRSAEVPALMASMKLTPRGGFVAATNAATALIETGELASAEQMLMVAKRLGQEALIDEEYTEDEVEEELAPVTVQLAFTVQAQGRSEEALELYTGLLKRKPGNGAAVAVASNNLAALRGRRDLFDSLKRTERLVEVGPGEGGGKPALLFGEGLGAKLSDRQKEVVAANRFLLLLHSNKLDQAREFLAAFEASFPSSSSRLPLQASLLLQRSGKKGGAAAAGRAEDLRLLGGAEGARGAGALVRAQLAVLAGDFAAAAGALEAAEGLRHRLGTVATLAALKERVGDVKGAGEVLDAAIAYWDSKQGEGGAEVLETLLQEAAAFRQRQRDHQAAARLLSRLASSADAPVRNAALVGLVSSTADFDVATAEKYEAQLPALPVRGLDVAALERSGGAGRQRVGEKRPGGAAAGGDGAADGEGGERVVKPKKKRKRKVLLPKGFDPANPGPPPDPERWLPRRDRSSFKTKRRDKGKAQLRGAQGAVAKEKAGEGGGAGGAGAGGGGSAGGAGAGGKAAAAPADDKGKAPPAASGKNKKKGRR